MFDYFNHGLGGINDSSSLYVWFDKAPERARAALTRQLNWPAGLSPVKTKDWCGHHVHVYVAYGKHDGFGAHVLGCSNYTTGTAPEGWSHIAWEKLDHTKRQLVGFEASLDGQLERIHDEYPIAFVLRVCGKLDRSPRHTESIARLDAALELAVTQLDVSTRDVAPLADTRTLYRELLTLRCSKHGGSTMAKAKREKHLALLLDRFDQDDPWDDLKVALKLKAAKPADVIARLPAKTRKKVWRSAWRFQGEGDGAYSAAVFKLPKGAYDALKAEYG